MKSRILSLIFTSFCIASTFAQLSVQGGYTAQQLAEIMAGNNIVVTNASISGGFNTYGAFNGTNTNLGINSGVLLSTGSLQSAIGPNNTESTTVDNGMPGTSQMDALAGTQTFDAVTLQFDFTVQTESIEFKYVFGSEEYLEYVNAGFNDVFAFYISGPGITGEENIALVPNTTAPVTINNINDQSYWQYYINNDNGNTIQFDGFTTVLTAKRDNLTPCGTYTLKLVIADAGDGVWDSGVFLQENSLVQGEITAVSNTVTVDNTALEGCTDASFTFNLDSAYNEPTDVYIGVGGNAVNGVDYTYIDSIFTIPAGQTSATIVIDALADGLTEGQEVVELYYSPTPCAVPDTVYLYINDNEPIDFYIDGNNLGCFEDNSGEIVAHVTGGSYPYDITVIDSLGNETHYSDTIIPGLPAGTYTVEVNDQYGCGGDAVVVGASYDAGQTFLPDGNGNVYTTDLVLSEFGSGETLNSLSQLQSVCLNMEHSYLGDVEMKLIAPNGAEVILKERPGGNRTNLGEPVANGPVDGANPDTTPGIGYEYCFTPTPNYLTMVEERNNYDYTYTDATGNVLTDKYLPQGAYTSYESLSQLIGTPLNGTWTIWVKDWKPQDNGYIFSWSLSFSSGREGNIVELTQPDTTKVVAANTQANCGSNDGAIDISVTGPNPPFQFNWSTGATTEDISGVGAGSYELTVTDANNCNTTATFLVQNASSMSLSSTHTNVSCLGGNDGSIDLTITGGTQPYSISWNNGASTEDIFNLTPGIYTVTVTDAANCSALASVEILQTPALTLNTPSITNESCGNENGVIVSNVIGGTTPYSYNWSNGITTANVDFLQAGTYTLTVSDANGCSVNGSYDIINEVTQCQVTCDIVITNTNITDENCGNGQGMIDVTISGGTQPYTYSWDNGSTSEDITNLNAGAYAINITDANGCSQNGSYTVNNMAANLNISGNVNNETCGNGQGAVDITVTGGAMPYSYSWNNGASTEDLSVLSAGTYTITLTDANFCSTSATYTVANNSGTLTQTYGNAMDEVCGQTNGSIDITITGGTFPYSFSWNNGGSTQDLINIQAGTYSCTITDGSGCSINTPVYTVNNDAGTLSIFDTDIANEICGNGLGRLNVDMTGGTQPYAYNWSTGDTEAFIDSLSTGTYQCTITDANGCSIQTGNLDIINESGTLTLTSVTTTNETCGNSLGAVDVTVTGAGTLTYQWDHGAATEDLSNLSAGTYHCVITDTNQCSVNANATIINSQGTLNVDNAIIQPEVCGDGSGSIDLVVSGGSATIQYAWSNGAITEDLISQNAGNYNVTITDANGCQINQSYTINNTTTGLNLDNIAITNETCGNSDGMIDLTVSGGTTPYTFNWNNTATTEDISGLSAGTYSASITDNSGCSLSTGNININNFSGGFFISDSLITDESCGNGAGAIDITVSNASAPAFLWSNGATTEDLTGLIAGTYSVDVMENGCTYSASFIVENNAGNLAFSGNVITNEICSNGAGAINITVSGTTTPSFLWSNGNTTEDLTNLSAGTYTVTVSDNGCSINKSYIVNNDPGNLSIDDISVLNEQCGDGTGSVNLLVTGGVNPLFNWSNGATTEDITGLSTGTYSVVITDDNNCTTSTSANVFNNPGTLEIVSETLTHIDCSSPSGSINIEIGGATTPTYQWSNGEITQDINGLIAGSYTCIITENNCSINYSATITENQSDLSISNATIVNESCSASTGSIDLTITGSYQPFTFNWSNGSSMEDINFLTAGNYNVSVTDATGCVVSESYNLINQPLTLSVISVIDDTCSQNVGQVATFISGGSGSYNYFVDGQFVINVGNTFVDLGAGDHILEVRDINIFGCTASVNVTVPNNPGNLNVTYAITEDNCGQSIGGIDLSISGSSGTASFNWSDGSVSEDIVNIPSGDYSCLITDGSGCTYNTGALTVNNLASFTVSNTFSNENCGMADGTINLTISGGTTPFTYSWSNGGITEDLNGISEGDYSCIITDNTGCSFETETIGISNSTTFSVSNNITNENCGDALGAIDLTISGGTSPFTFNWSSGDLTEDVVGLPSGNYSVIITDNLGCTYNGSYEVYDDQGGMTTNIIANDDNCGQGTGSVQVFVNGGNSPFTYQWTPTLGNSSYIPNLYAGKYIVLVTDANGCSAIDTAIIENIADSEISMSSITNATCIICTNGSIDITVTPTGQFPPGSYTYVWSNGATTEDVSGLMPGNYTVTVTEDGFNGPCSFSETFTVGNGFTGIDNYEILTVNIYPNPANDQINIQFMNDLNKLKSIELLNALGEVVTQEVINNSLMRINIAHLERGIYFVKVNGKSNYQIQKIIIQ